MKVIHGTRPEDYDVTEYKTCPVCDAVCFADMEVCFGCLHHFEDARLSKTELQTAIDTIIDQEIDEPTIPLQERGAPEAKLPNQAPVAPNEKTRASSDVAIEAAVENEPATSGHHECCDTTCKSDEGLTAHHVCQGEDGKRFEISISIRML